MRKASPTARIAWEETVRGRVHRILTAVPIMGRLLVQLHAFLRRENSASYWEDRYRRGQDSGSGSYGRLAAFKAEVINNFVVARGIRSVLELGCGDGHQLELAKYPAYIGVDISETALALCRRRFAADGSKQFMRMGAPEVPKADCVLSLDVILHLVEDEVFESYMRDLFGKSTRYVIIYSSDFDDRFAAPHVRHRQFTPWVSREQPQFVLDSVVRNPHASELGTADTSNADFYIYRRSEG